MKQNLFFAITILIVILAGCRGPKVIAPVLSNKAEAEKATAEGNYTQAVKAWKNHFSEQTLAEIPGADYQKQGKRHIKPAIRI